MNIIFIRSDTINPSVRLEKDATTLSSLGHNVTILGWVRRGHLLKNEQRNGYNIHRFHIRAAHGMPVVFSWPFWWASIAYWISKHDCDIVHAADFDSYFPALIVAKLMHKKIIYDVCDYFPDSILKPVFIHKIFSKIDRFLMAKADKIIIADECRLEQIGRPGDKSITVIYNVPNISVSKDLAQSSSKTNQFKIFYAGYIIPMRDLLSMIRFAEEHPEVSLTIAGLGYPELLEKIQKRCQDVPNASYIGSIPYDEVIRRSLESDLLFAFYDPIRKSNRYASPNKLFEAMMCGKPILMNGGIASADIVQRENCGLLIPYGDYEALEETVLRLMNDPALCKKLGENGRKAYEEKYNWNNQEKKLLGVYRNIL